MSIIEAGEPAQGHLREAGHCGKVRLGNAGGLLAMHHLAGAFLQQHRLEQPHIFLWVRSLDLGCVRHIKQQERQWEQSVRRSGCHETAPFRTECVEPSGCDVYPL